MALAASFSSQYNGNAALLRIEGKKMIFKIHNDMEKN